MPTHTPPASTEGVEEAKALDGGSGDISHDTPQRKEWVRQAVGFFSGILLAIVVYYLFPQSAADTLNSAYPDAKEPYTYQALRTTAAGAVLMGVWWMTEAIPLAATALVPLALFPLAQIVDFGDISGQYGNPTIFLFMGGFIVALAMQRWNLHRRLALNVVLLVGTKPKQLVAGFMIATGVMSMWVSNTATAVVMLPIGVSILALTAEQVGGFEKQKRFGTALMLGIAYSASIGSLGTIIGTPPNALLIGYLSDNHDVHIGFGQWMLVGVPLAAVFMAVAWFVLVTVFKPEISDIPGGRELIREELHKMGPMQRGEVYTGLIFVSAALAWIIIPIAIRITGSDLNIADAAIGMTAALLLFSIPADRKRGVRLIDWKTAAELPWDVLLLFGGGLALSKMFSVSGLSLWIGELARNLGVLPIMLIVAVVAGIVLILTEFTSNTATAAAFLPIMGGVSVGLGLTEATEMNVMLLTVPVALAATCAFMLPVATPPNAIAFGSGHVTIGEMVKGGVWLNIIGVFLITATVFALAVPIFGLVL